MSPDCRVLHFSYRASDLPQEPSWEAHDSVLPDSSVATAAAVADAATAASADVWAVAADVGFAVPD